MVDEVNWDPAGADVELARAGASARADRSAGVVEVLAQCREDFALRAHRSLVLGSACADSDVAEELLKDDPECPDRTLLYARTVTARALRLADRRDPRAGDVAVLASWACEQAAQAAPDDPTPYVVMLALARVERWSEMGPVGLEHVRGPWPLLSAVRCRDDLNREGHHRFLACLFPRFGGSHDAMWSFAWYLAQVTPKNSDLQVLPLIAFAENYRTRRDASGAPGADLWPTERAMLTALDLYEGGWLRRVLTAGFPPISDLSHVAHALLAGNQTAQAGRVLEAMGGHGATLPWSLFGDPLIEFHRARAKCYLCPL
jgi:hypothetical protein